MGSWGEVGAKELCSSPSAPVVTELNRLENNIREKERELGLAHSEIKALKATEILKDKAMAELSNELQKLDGMLRTAEKQLEHKTLEIKKLTNEKKDALAAQFAAETTLRRVYTTEDDEEYLPVEAVIAPLESSIKKYKNEIAILKEDKKALERITKSQEAALIEAENILRCALERALIVETVQNQNIELRRQIEICQEENRLLEKTNRQKVVQVEKLMETVRELEESILAGGAAANAVRDYQRQVSELTEEKKTLERELARAKVSANRVAKVIANEWKDENGKVMPVKQWLEERRFFQGEIQRLRDKLAVAERTAKAEAQLKDKVKLRLKTLEEILKHASTLAVKQNGNFKQISGFPACAGPKQRSTSQPRAYVAANRISVLQQPNSVPEGVNASGSMRQSDNLKTKFIIGENLVRKNSWASKSKFVDDSRKENTERNSSSNVNVDDSLPKKTEVSLEVKAKHCCDTKSPNEGGLENNFEDMVSGFLFDKLQKEVLKLRKLHEKKDELLTAKDDEIKLLQKKVDTLTKALEVESKKMRREAATIKHEASVKSDYNKEKTRTHKHI